MLRDLPPLKPQPGIEVFMSTPGNEDEPPAASTEYVDPLDDVFGSAPTSPTLSGQVENGGSRDDPRGVTLQTRSSDHPSDVSRLRRIHVTNGYREGIAASKETQIQAGFDEGYSLGADIALKAGYILGALEGLCRAVPTASPRDVENERESTMKGTLQGLAQEAALELTLEKLIDGEYFGEDGIWRFEVEGEECEEDEVTFAKVAEAHPVVKKWMERLRVLCTKLGVVLDQSSEG